MSLPMSDAALETIRTNVKRRGARRDQRYRGNVARSVSGLAACKCHGKRLGQLRGYRVAILNQRTGISGIGAPTDMALIPISDKSAVTNAVKFFVAARQRKGISGLGDSAQAQGAAGTSMAGAKAGTAICPGIGTVIGAVVGAVVGWLAGKSKPVRASAEQIAQCKATLTEYMSYAAQSPNAALPMEWTQLLDMNWCYQALYGAEIKLKDPRWFNPGFESGLRPMAIDIVKKIYETPVGATVNLDAISFRDPKGRTIKFDAYSFVNPLFTNIKTFSEQYFEKMDLAFCEATASAGAAGCKLQRSHAEWKRLLFDLLFWAARTTLPNISEADLIAASQVAQATGTAAKDVVSAVEQIINRSVIKGETSVLLTGQTDQPGVVAPSTAPPLPGVTVPGVTPQAAADVTALIAQLVAQNASANQATQAALDALKERGTSITPAVTASVQKEIALQQAGVSAFGTTSSALLTGGGILAALFLLARPAAARRTGRR